MPWPGIATKDAPNMCHGYVALLGSDDQVVNTPYSPSPYFARKLDFFCKKKASFRIISGLHKLLFNNSSGLTSLHKLRSTYLNQTNDKNWQPTLAELGLELGRQPPPAQRRLAGQLPTTEQCSQISGSSIFFVICTWTHQQVGREKFS